MSNSTEAKPVLDEARHTQVEKLLARGPGVVTGAADDGPSGIATYSQAGAQFGFAMLFSFPLMAAIREICGRLGRITGLGLAANLAKCCPKVLARCLVLLLCLANIFNLGTDVSAMAAAIQLVAGGAVAAYALIFAAGSLLLQIYVPYRKYARDLKWLTWSLFAYVITAFVLHIPWAHVLKATVIPSISFNPDYLMALIAVLGTTISPYPFFWQTSQEVEEVRGDAHALQPFAGHCAFLLFALGIVGTGMLAIPELAGSAAYAVGWRASLEKQTASGRQILYSDCGVNRARSRFNSHRP
jgi:Mn2+/Fe2+ NRAMP family transporter